MAHLTATVVRIRKIPTIPKDSLMAASLLSTAGDDDGSAFCQHTAACSLLDFVSMES